MITDPTCPLCHGDPAQILWEDSHCLVIAAEAAGLGTLCRVIWRDHVAEMTDLDPGRARQFMEVVWGVETALRRCLAPTKMNVASLGNMVPHLHWHVIPRYADDAYFPDSIWARARRTGTEHRPHTMEDLRRALGAALAERLAATRDAGTPPRT